jgi:hypothetical protein
VLLMLLGIGLLAIELLICCTMYILSWLGWMLPELLGNGLLLMPLSNGLLLGYIAILGYYIKLLGCRY